MEQFFKHRGYFGSSEWSQEDNCFHGRIIDITDLVTYEGADTNELEKSFKEAVDDYVETLREIKKERIDINIWDDYHDDGYVPEGEKQETYMYVESASVPVEDQLRYLQQIFDYIEANLHVNGVKYWMYFYISREVYPEMVNKMWLFNRWEIRIENLTHERREELVEQLQQANLSLDGIPFNIYSES